jgi:hypothetical protein
MVPEIETTATMATRAALAALVRCEAVGGSKRAAFEAALQAWQEFRPEDGPLGAHERVIPLVLALEDAAFGRPH